MTLAPRLEMVCSTEEEEPRPISIMAMTAATPMTMPRMVRMERITFRRRACKAMRSVPRSDFIGSTFAALRDKRIFCPGIGGLNGLAGDDLLTIAQGVGMNHGICAVGGAGFDADGFSELAVLQPD